MAQRLTRSSRFRQWGEPGGASRGSGSRWAPGVLGARVAVDHGGGEVDESALSMRACRAEFEAPPALRSRGRRTTVFRGGCQGKHQRALAARPATSRVRATTAKAGAVLVGIQLGVPQRPQQSATGSATARPLRWRAFTSPA